MLSVLSHIYHDDIWITNNFYRGWNGPQLIINFVIIIFYMDIQILKVHYF